MKSRAPVLTIALVFALFCFPAVFAHAQQQDFSVPPAKTDQPSDAPIAARMCNSEHMSMMLQNPQDRECVAENVLQDKATTEIIMNKIVANPELRQQMFQKIHAKMQERMMQQHKGMQGQGGMMQGQGGMMQGQGGMMQGQGGMMGGQGGMMQEQSE
jgi:hypothetical protein